MYRTSLISPSLCAGGLPPLTKHFLRQSVAETTLSPLLGGSLPQTPRIRVLGFNPKISATVFYSIDRTLVWREFEGRNLFCMSEHETSFVCSDMQNPSMGVWGHPPMPFALRANAGGLPPAPLLLGGLTPPNPPHQSSGIQSQDQCNCFLFNR